MTAIPFIKMHGAGNDFVVIDDRDGMHAIADFWASWIADRHFGIGCDQVIVLEASKEADVFMRIYNADGSEIGACGNATRCVGWLIMDETGSTTARIQTRVGILECKKSSNFQITVDMGSPNFDWQDIPLSEPRNTEHLGIANGMLMDPVAVGMGNPHMVFFVKDLEFIRMAESGKALEHHPLFPERANISAAQVLSRDAIRLVVWERGAGLTMACGTAACATLAAGVRRGLVNRHATIHLPGGELQVQWEETTGHILMTGPVAVVFRGHFDREKVA